MRHPPAPPHKALFLRRLAMLPPGLATGIASLSAVPVVAIHAGLWHAAYAVLLIGTAWLAWVNRRRLRTPSSRLTIVSLLALSVPVTGFPLANGVRFAAADLPLFVVLATLAAGSPRLHQVILRSYVGLLAVTVFAMHSGVA